jgi:hypothetical protein
MPQTACHSLSQLLNDFERFARMSSWPPGSPDLSDGPSDGWELSWIDDVPFNDAAQFADEIDGRSRRVQDMNARVSAISGSRPNRIRKGTGRNSKSKAPDPHDNYYFEMHSLAWCRLRMLGYNGITLQDLVRVQQVLQIEAQSRGIVLSGRNRAAQRRKPCGFHWIDENMHLIGRQMFEGAVFSVLGWKVGTKKRGPKGQQGE